MHIIKLLVITSIFKSVHTNKLKNSSKYKTAILDLPVKFQHLQATQSDNKVL